MHGDLADLPVEADPAAYQVDPEQQPVTEAELTLAALDMAIKRRRPLPGLMHHSDRGSQAGLDKFIFGQAASLIGSDVYVMAGCALVTAVLCFIMPLSMGTVWMWPLLLLMLGLSIGRHCIAAIVDPQPRKVQAAVKFAILSMADSIHLAQPYSVAVASPLPRTSCTTL